MAEKYDPEKDYAQYLELAKEQQELEKRQAELDDEKKKLNEKVDLHLENARSKLGFDNIKTAAYEFQVEILNKITMAVIESQDLEKAVKLIDHLETHLEARLRLSGKHTPVKDSTPTVSPAIAARKTATKQTSATNQPAKTKQAQAAGTKQASTATTPPPPPPSSGKKGGRVVERRTILNDSLNELCRYEYEDERLARMVFLDSNNNPTRTHQMIYDKAGKLVQEIHIDRAGVTLEVLDRETDKDSKIIRETVRNAHNEIMHTVDFKYDRHDKLIKKEWRDSRNKRTKTWEYKYDKDSKEPTHIIWRDERNKPYGEVELRYDDKGHITQELSKDRSGSVIRGINYQYFYG